VLIYLGKRFVNLTEIENEPPILGHFGTIKMRIASKIQIELRMVLNPADIYRSVRYIKD